MKNANTKNNIKNNSKSDSEEIKISKKNSPDDFTELLSSIATSINYKLSFIIFIGFIILCSDVFIENILSHFSDATSYNVATTYGTVIQGLFLVLLFIAADGLIKSEIV